MADAGVALSGPGSFAIQAMGDTMENKLLAKSAQDNTIPGFYSIVENTDQAVEDASDSRYNNQTNSNVQDNVVFYLKNISSGSQ